MTQATQVEPPPATCPGITWRVGATRFTQSPRGCITAQTVGGGVPDGQYTNPILTFVGGHIASVRPGSQIVVVPPDPCARGGADPSTPGGLALSTDPCSVLEYAAGAYGAFVHIEGTGPIAVAGCGTAANPFVLSLDLPGGVAGVDASGCGITIDDGIVTQWVNPVMSVSVVAGSGLSVAVNPLACGVTLGYTPPASATRIPPALVCNADDPGTPATLVGLPNTTYEIALPNAGALTTTVVTNSLGLVSAGGLNTGVYEFRQGGVTISYLLYTRCVYTPP